MGERCFWTVILVAAAAIFPAARGMWLDLPSSTRIPEHDIVIIVEETDCLQAKAFRVEEELSSEPLTATYQVMLAFELQILGKLSPVIGQNMFYAGMKYSSATFTSAMCNLISALTFVLAWILRIEKVNLKTVRSHAKIMGTLVTVENTTTLYDILKSWGLFERGRCGLRQL
ncbi:wat1-related protein at2g39510 [Phtheirospermum japonicum]|uniref:Wat1-related protein at2g39510 n=1 Tax=Phtheirospermum japonicum TaxID=374723 RepID=A0A830BHZ4_9LAMI|nr:wat1-related protein at2g39510 [Phtheirospermum japonicum]